MFAISRLALLLVAVFTLADAPGVAAATAGSFLCKFDCNWYMSIAEYGYSTAESLNQPGATNFAFYPLYPLLVGELSRLLHMNPLAAAVAISNFAFLLSLRYIQRYLVEFCGAPRSTALLTLALICFLPQSLAFSVPYSESLFLLLLVVAMYYVRREQFLAAGVAAALLSATRANGIFFLLFVLVWIWRHRGAFAFALPWRTPEVFVPVVLAPLGLFLFWGYCFMATGDAFAHPSSELHGWGWQFTAPWENVPVAIRSEGMPRIAMLVSIGVFSGTLLLLRQRMFEEFALCAGCLVLVWSGGSTGSIFRYWLFAFPIWYVFARFLQPRPVATVFSFAVLSVVNGAFTCAWLLQKVFAI